MPLQFTSTSRPGVYALRKQWTAPGLWTLVIAVAQGEVDQAQAIVELDAAGTVSHVEVPTRAGERADMPLPRHLSAHEIDLALRQRARVAGTATAAARAR